MDYNEGVYKPSDFNDGYYSELKITGVIPNS